jgi:hypothetical protein
VRGLSSGTIGRQDGRRGWLMAAGAAGIVAAGGLGWAGWRVFQQREAQRLLQAGLDAQFAQAQFDIARNHYRLALQHDPALGIAHYHLATVYLRLYTAGGSKDALLLRDAGGHFRAALQTPAQLDSSQARDAQAQLGELDRPDEAAPVTRVAQAEARPRADGGRATPPARAETGGRGAAATATAPPSPAPAPAPEVPSAASAPPSTDMPRRVPAPAELQRQADTLAEALFGGDAGERAAATNTLTLRPVLAAEALPRALALALAAAPRATAEAGARDGVLSTVALLQGASPATLRHNDAAARRLAVAAAGAGAQVRDAAARLDAQLQRSAARRPLIYLQIAHEAQRALADALVRRLRAAGYDAPAVERVAPGRAPERTELRTQGASDPGLARWCRDLAATESGEAVTIKLLRNARPATDTYELWLGRGLCAPGAPPAPACLR